MMNRSAAGARLCPFSDQPQHDVAFGAEWFFSPKSKRPKE